MAYILIDVRGLGSHSGTSNARSAQEATASLEPPTRPDTDTTATSSHSGSSDPLLYSTTTTDSTAQNSHVGTRPASTSVHSGSGGTTRTTTTSDDAILYDYTQAAFEAALQEQQAAQQAEQRYNATAATATADLGTQKKWPWILAALAAAGLLGYAVFGGKNKKNK